MNRLATKPQNKSPLPVLATDRVRFVGQPIAMVIADTALAAQDAAELVEMVETARQYQNNVQVLETAKGLINETLRLGQ